MLDVTRRIAMALLGAALTGALLVSVAMRPTSSAQPGTVLPPANGRLDYQIGGHYPPKASVRIVDRDRAAPAVPGRYNICYVNAFQTQPGESGSWPDSAILTDDRGRPIADDGWPGEYLLDTSTAATRATILSVLSPWLRDCRTRGFPGR